MVNKILQILEKNSKLSAAKIAEELETTEEEVIAIIAELEEKKIICGYNCIIDWDKIVDDKVTALIEVKVTPQCGTGFDRIANRIAKYEEVDSVYLISGGYDFMVQIKGKSMKEVSKFVFEKLSTLEMIQSTATHFVLKKYKDHGISLETKFADKRENLLV